jgi:hypothetical protein
LLSPELDGKPQEILIAAGPGASRIAAVADARATPSYHIQMLQQAAQSRGVELSVFGVVSGPEERQSGRRQRDQFFGEPVVLLKDANVGLCAGFRTPAMTIVCAR